MLRIRFNSLYLASLATNRICTHGLKMLGLDRFRWAAPEFQPQHISPEFRPPDLEMPAQRLVWPFDVKLAAVVIFELPLDQNVCLIAIVGFLKTH